MSSITALAGDALKQASDVAQADGTRLIDGPYDVGNLGRVSIVGKKWGDGAQEYVYAEFTGKGRPARIPLAAVATLSRVLFEQGMFEEEIASRVAASAKPAPADKPAPKKS